MSSKATPTVCLAFGAVATAVGAALLFKKVQGLKKKEVKVTYFDLAATPGEKLRLALVLAVGKDGFTDDRVKFADWPERKKSMKYGQMPVVTIDGVDNYQSGATLRHIGARLGDGSLYPINDAAQVLKIEEMLGLADDLQRAWNPALYVGMKPSALGHGALEGDAKAAKVSASLKWVATFFLLLPFPIPPPILSHSLVRENLRSRRAHYWRCLTSSSHGPLRPGAGDARGVPEG